ncbi:MAG: SPFH domain-containing protein [Chitinispirillia bacterium]|jgi:regulator of protease activity HflC (stomatin/prohibitin superfamily)
MQSERQNTKDKKSYLDHMEHGGNHIGHFESISVALKTGFFMLKILIFILGTAFLFSNIFWVPEGFVAVQTRFGSFVGPSGKQVIKPGGPYFALPYPIDNVVQIPTTIQRCSVDKAFWLENVNSEHDSIRSENRSNSQSLIPGEDGSLITADKNIVQGIWRAYFQLKHYSNSNTDNHVMNFLLNTGTMERADSLVKQLLQEAIVFEVARTSLGDFVAGRINHKAVARRVQKKLSMLKSGLRLTTVSASRYSVPRILKKEFQMVTEAESDKALRIEKAVRYRVSTLGEIAGEDWETLLLKVTEFEMAVERGDSFEEQKLKGTIENMLLSGQIGGSFAQKIDNARSARTSTIEKARASAERFRQLLHSYRKNPNILRNQLLQDALEYIWSSKSVSTQYVPAGKKIYLNLNEQRIYD